MDEVSLTSETSTSLTVVWNKVFYDGNKTASSYNITYQESDCSTSNSTSGNGGSTVITVNELDATPINNTRLQYNLTGLKKWTGYTVLISAFYPNGSILGNTSTLKCQTTLEDGRLFLPS